MVFETAMPVPDIEPRLVTAYADMCAESLDESQRLVEVSAPLERLSERERACLAMRTYAGCMAFMSAVAETLAEPDRTKHVQALNRHLRHVHTEATRRCEGVDEKATARVQATIVRDTQATIDAWLRNLR